MFVIGVFVACFWRVLKAQKPKNEHSFQDLLVVISAEARSTGESK